MNSTKGLSVNIEHIPTLFLQGKPDRLYICSVEKYSGAAIEDTYPRYTTEMTRQAHGGRHRPILQQDGTLNPPQLHLADAQSAILNLSSTPLARHVPEFTNLFTRPFHIGHVVAHLVLGSRILRTGP
jgi:hypothetical protein